MREAKLDRLKSYRGAGFAFLLGAIREDRREQFAPRFWKMISNYLRERLAHGL